MDSSGIPTHVGIIMDGNGRWAKRRLLPRAAGHRAGMENVKRIIRYSSDHGIKILTLYAFSTENWKRPQKEVGLLMSLLLEYLRREIDELHEERVVVRTIGDAGGLPAEVRELLHYSYEKTKNNTGMILNLALNYGGRDELVRCVKDIAARVRDGELRAEDVGEDTIASGLYTAGLPDPDLIIRTSGEQRISNFLIYQMAYSELYFSPVHWPDFKEEQYAVALAGYAARTRRFGGLTEEGEE